MGFMVVSVTPAQYFNKKRGLANGIVYAGGGLGGAVISFVMNALIQKVGVAWTFRIIGLMTLATGVPGAWLVKERAPIKKSVFIDRYALSALFVFLEITRTNIFSSRLLRDWRFIVLFSASAIATFPLFVPPFFLPLYGKSIGLTSSTGAALVAGFNFASAVGRIGCGLMCDKIGPLNTLLISLLVSAGSMLVMWPVSSTIGPLAAFTVINGIANGGFFSTMPTVVGSVFGSVRVGVALGMVVSGWSGGYLMVSGLFRGKENS
jgi:MFS family permease